MTGHPALSEGFITKWIEETMKYPRYEGFHHSAAEVVVTSGLVTWHPPALACAQAEMPRCIMKLTSRSICHSWHLQDLIHGARASSELVGTCGGTSMLCSVGDAGQWGREPGDSDVLHGAPSGGPRRRDGGELCMAALRASQGSALVPGACATFRNRTWSASDAGSQPPLIDSLLCTAAVCSFKIYVLPLVIHLIMSCYYPACVCCEA